MTKTDFITENPASGSDKMHRIVLRTGGIFTILVLLGILIDIVAGNITGGDISSLPQNAIDRFQQLQDHTFLGLYNLDLLNVINQIATH